MAMPCLASKWKMFGHAPEKGKKRLRKLVASPTFRGATIFANSSLTSVRRANSKVWLNKPIQVGQAVLDMSKSVMYEYWYGIVKPLWEIEL